MKVFKNRVGLKIVFIILLVIVMSPNIVDAEKNSSNGKCISALFYGGDPIVVSKENDAYKVTNINLKNGTWDLYYRIIDNDDGADYSDVISTQGGFRNGISSLHTYDGTSNNPIPKALQSISRGQNNKEVFIFMTLRKYNNSIHGMDNSGGKLVAGKDSDNNDIHCIAGDSSIFSLVKGSDKASPNLNIKKIDDKTPTYIIKKFTVPAKLNKTRVNKSADNQCVRMKNGQFFSDGSNSQFNLTGEELNGYNTMMKNSFPYCYDGSDSSFEIDSKTIRKVRQDSLKAYKAYLKFKAAQNNNEKFDAASAEISSGGYLEGKYDSEKNLTLVNSNNNALSCSKSDNTETTKKYYIRREVVNNDMCKVTCQEQFHVTYDPPVAVKAGLCFQYKVTVRSKVTCKTETKPKFSWPTVPDTCTYVPICNNNDSSTQAGPNEDFDSCVNSCDNGKYTQSCINSCYKKVYKSKENNSSTKKTSVGSNVTSKTGNIVKLAAKIDKNKDPYYVLSKKESCNKIENIKKHPSKCAELFRDLKQKYPMGKYTKNTSDDNEENWIEYRWISCFYSNKNFKQCEYTSDDDDDSKLKLTVERFDTSKENHKVLAEDNEDKLIENIKRASPYYFRDSTVAEKTLKSFYADGTGFNGYNGRRYYQFDNRGIKRQWSDTYQCHETCGYVMDGSGDENCLTSSDEVQKHYTEKFEKIKKKLEACTTKATCKESTSTFTINVTDKKKYTSGDKTEWKATNKTTKSSDYKQIGPSGDTGMFIKLECTDEQKKTTPLLCDLDADDEYAPGINGMCYGRDKKEYWQHYKTTITFPGTWINLKSAARVYDKPNSSELNKYRKEDKSYCTAFDSEPVNRKWWNWKENGEGDVKNITVEKDDNIQATVKNFGKFNWNVTLNCFFALCNEADCSDNGDQTTTPTTQENRCSNSNSTELCNYTFRPIDQSNIFPAKSGVGSRERGFNWTNKAKDNTIPSSSSYSIDPEEYFKKLQSTADSAFPKSDSEFKNSDYRVQLTTENIKNIKEYVKKNNFNTFDGTYTKVKDVNGLYYYTSRLLTNKNLVSTCEAKSGITGINNNN